MRAVLTSLMLLASWLPASPASGVENTGDPARETARQAADYLERVATPACAAVQLLSDEWQGLLNSDSAERILQWIQDFEQLNRYGRADTLSQLLGEEWSGHRHNEFWLQQARLLLQGQESSNAEHALRRLREPLDTAMAAERQFLLGQILLRQSRFVEAAEILAHAGTVFDRFNLALALLGQDRSTAQGRKLLDELSQQPMEGAEGLALRDRIHLTLGWSWLAAQKGGTARPYFRRVRLQGSDANLALLGLGWAELSANGRPQYAPRFMGFYHEFPFEPAVTGPARLQRALKPWQVLAQRAIHDPPVQEALLAIAYAHEKLRQPEDAAAAYRLAIRQYQAEIARLETLASALRSPGSDPRQVVEQQALSGEFTDVLASHGMAQIESELTVLQHCSEQLRDIRNGVEPYQRRLQSRLDPQAGWIQKSQSALLDDLRRRFLNDIANRRRYLTTYLARASLALAYLQDRRSSPGALQ